jgi:hypothetical protein
VALKALRQRGLAPRAGVGRQCRCRRACRRPELRGGADIRAARPGRCSSHCRTGRRILWPLATRPRDS